MRIHVVDTNPYSISANRALEDVSQVTKFRLTDDEYNTRDKTLRQWKNIQKEKDPTFTLQKHAVQHSRLQEAKLLHKRGLPLPPGFVYDDQSKQVVASRNFDVHGDDQKHDLYGPDSVDHCVVGKRCQIRVGERRGTVAWTGELQNHETGYWVGIELDEPTGKNDGTINGVRYFTTNPNYGAFVRGTQVDVGDYPIRDDMWDEDNDSDEEI
jgi:tubulin-folding cofactor B